MINFLLILTSIGKLMARKTFLMSQSLCSCFLFFCAPQLNLLTFQELINEIYFNPLKWFFECLFCCLTAFLLTDISQNFLGWWKSWRWVFATNGTGSSLCSLHGDPWQPWQQLVSEFWSYVPDMVTHGNDNHNNS